MKMMRAVRASGMVFVALTALSMAALAQQDGWQLKLGVSYRSFGDVDFSGFELRNFGIIDPADGNLGIQDYSNETFADIDEPAVFGTDHARYPGGDSSVSSSDSWAPVLGVERVVGARNGWVFSVVANLQYFNVDVSGGASADSDDAGNFETFRYMHQAVPPPGGISPDPLAGPFDGLSDGTSVAVTADFEMDLFVLDLGVKAAYPFDHGLSIFGAVGPTLSICLIDTERTESAEWNDFTNVRREYSNREKNDTTAVRIGAYASIGASLRLGERLAVAAEARYDEVFGSDPGTSIAKIDLSGASGIVKLMLSF